jgi:hypothetical protein
VSWFFDMATTLVEEKKETKKFKVSLDLGEGVVETLKGDTVAEALQGLGRHTIGFLRSKTVLRVSHGKKGTKAYKETEIVLLPRLARKLIANKTFRIIMQKRVLSALGGNV